MGRDIYTADRDTADTDPDNMEAFKGKYERTSADKYEELLKELDVNFLLRKAATVSTPVMEVTEEGGVWTIKTSTTLKTMELKFKVKGISSTLKNEFIPVVEKSRNTIPH